MKVTMVEVVRGTPGGGTRPTTGGTPGEGTRPTTGKLQDEIMKNSIVETDPVARAGEQGGLAGTSWRWSVVVMFAIAMAWVEAAVVYYLRTMIDRIEPYQPNPLPIVGGIGAAEVVREAATLVMLFTVGVLAGRTWRARWGYAALAFGIWDIFYYVFLRVLTDWPRTLLDWDILFLIPLPWWGPVWAPAAIALLMVLWGTLVTHFDDLPEIVSMSWASLSLSLVGMLLALALFMVDAYGVAGQGEHALRQLLPTHFNWPLFSVALLLMSAPILEICRRLHLTRLAGWAATEMQVP